MSSVRMCDTCHTIFSENEEDWTTGSIARRRRDPETGRVTTVDIAVDECGICTQRRLDPPKPLVPAVEGRYDERYTAQLEREAGIAPEPRTQAPS